MAESNDPDGAVRVPDREVPGAGDGGRRTSGRGLDSPTTKAVVGFASQTVVLTAVLFYFGWARVRATYAYFGIDVSVLNFSVTDYVQRSVSTAFPLLIALGILVAGAVFIHERLRPVLAGSDSLGERLGLGLSVAGGGLIAVGFVLSFAITGPGGSALPGPAVMLAGFATIVYALMLQRRYVSSSGAAAVVIASGLLVLTFLWTVTAYADFIGIQTAKQFRAGLSRAPDVVVYSSSDLSLTGPGIIESKVGSVNGAYRYRYSGLRMLVSSGDRYFLLPAGWTPATGSVIVLPITPSGVLYRVQFQGSSS